MPLVAGRDEQLLDHDRPAFLAAQGDVAGGLALLAGDKSHIASQHLEHPLVAPVGQADKRALCKPEQQRQISLRPRRDLDRGSQPTPPLASIAGTQKVPARAAAQLTAQPTQACSRRDEANARRSANGRQRRAGRPAIGGENRSRLLLSRKSRTATGACAAQAGEGAAECRRGDYCRGVPPNFQRFLPFVLLALVALFVLPALLKKHTSGPSASTRATQTIDAMNLIDKGEQAYKTVHGRFTPHLADLLPLNTRLANDLAVGLAVQLDVSTNGQRFLAEVASNVLSLVRARGGAKITAQSCLILKSGSGVKCPAPVS